MGILFVEHPKCNTCKKAQRWLESHDIPFESRSIVEQVPTADELKAWQAKSGLPLRRFFNVTGMKYRQLKVKEQLDAGMSDEDAFALLASNGMLIKRPLLVSDDFVLVGFKEADWEQALLS